ncbi:uracil-DNA glycosylase family protein [Paenibacillus sp. GCM10027627]|uniref:uracil-DNA glycosylase family protein n=1 Tax=unclassified Paenibacillus TaxID=185978 RepID=UPI00363C3835
MADSRIGDFKKVIENLPGTPWKREDLLIPELLLEREKDLELYYAPYDYVNPAAKVMIVGITPGFTQMSLSIQTAKQDLASASPLSDIDRRAKIEASFAGSMRVHLIAMLNELGLPSMLGLRDSSDLFGPYRELIHTTSVIRYPLFRKGDNYTGHQPKMLSSALIRKYAMTGFANELAAVSDAVVIPLGKSVAEVLGAIALEDERFQDGALQQRCLFGFPHPSGANGHRKKQFEALKEEHRSTLSKILLN